VSSGGSASDRQLLLSLGKPGDETVTETRGEDAPVEGTDLMERVLERENLRRALRQVRANRGGPGIDGMTVEGLVPHLKAHWPAIRTSLMEGTYKPQPVRRVEIPKAGGGTRNLGVPTVPSYCVIAQ
jgi:RNA-directed DNA polymerase